VRKEIKALHVVIPLLAEDADWIENGLAPPLSASQVRGTGSAGVQAWPQREPSRRVDAAEKAVTSRKTGSALKRRSQARKLEPQPSDLPNPHRAENEACPGPDPGPFVYIGPTPDFGRRRPLLRQRRSWLLHLLYLAGDLRR